MAPLSCSRVHGRYRRLALPCLKRHGSIEAGRIVAEFWKGIAVPCLKDMAPLKRLSLGGVTGGLHAYHV